MPAWTSVTVVACTLALYVIASRMRAVSAALMGAVVCVLAVSSSDRWDALLLWTVGFPAVAFVVKSLKVLEG
jgi:hypothetical protein